MDSEYQYERQECPYQPQGKKKIKSDQYNVLKFSLGQRKCSSSSVDKFIDLYLLSLIVVLVFLLLWSGWWDQSLASWTNHQDWILVLFKAAILFLVVFVADLLLKEWRQNNVLCHELL